MSASRHHRSTDESLVQRWSLRVVDASLAAVLLLAPLFFGGRHGLGLLVYAAIVALAATAWLLHQTVSPWQTPRLSRWAIGLLAAACCLVMAQLAPVPANLFATLSPGLSERLPLWSGVGVLPSWNTLSVEPWSTRVSLAVLLTHAVLFVVVTGRVRKQADAERVIRLVACAGVGMAVLALVQYASRTDSLLGFYTLPFRDISRAAVGSFTSPNHCGHFLAVAAGAVLYCTLRSARAKGQSAAFLRGRKTNQGLTRDQIELFAWCLGMAALCLAVLLTFSRGAAIALALGLGVSGVMLARTGWVSRRLLLQASVLGLLAMIGLSTASYDQAARQMGGVTALDLEELGDTSGREEIWRANRRAFAANPWLGYGAGTHAVAYPLFMESPSRMLFTHAESGYLQVGTETGLAGLILLTTALLLVGGWCLTGFFTATSGEEQALWAVIAAGLCVSAVHSIADFVWYIPSCLAPVIMLSAVAERLRALRAGNLEEVTHARDPLAPITRWAGVLASVGCVALLYGPGLAATHRDAYDAESNALKHFSASQFAQIDSPNEAETARRLYETQLYYVGQMLESLQLSEKQDGANPQVQLRLARLSLQKFELTQAVSDNALGLDAIRQAALDAGFDSPDALRDWLVRAYGEDSQLLYQAQQHAAHALRGSPLLGEAYLQLADLAYLSLSPDDFAQSLVDQALVVRPYDGQVLFESGRHWFYAGKHDQALELWSRSASRPGVHRVRLAAAASSLMSGDEFIERFQPDWQLTQAAFGQYKLRGVEADLQTLAMHAMIEAGVAVQSDTPLRAAIRWRQASAIQASLGDLDAAIECASQAYQLAPHEFHVRLTFADALYQAERYEESDPHIRWCLARRPDNAGLRNRLERIAKHRAEQRIQNGVVRTAMWATSSGTKSEGPEPRSNSADKTATAEE